MEMCPVQDGKCWENNSPELCMAILFEQGAIPISIFGINDTITASLLAGFAYANDNFFKHLSSYLDNIDFEEDHKILNNFMNKGFYLTQFTNIKTKKKYGLLFRLINEKIFCQHWINKILIKISKKLEEAEEIAQKASDLLSSFNEILWNEIKIIQLIYKQVCKEKSENKLLFRKSGARAGSIDDPRLEKIVNKLINNFELCSEMNLALNGFKFSAKPKEIKNLDYIELKFKHIKE